MFRYYLLLCLSMLLSGYVVPGQTTSGREGGFNTGINRLALTDISRNRTIPIAEYFPVTEKEIKGQKIVIFSHGYGANKPGSNEAYSYLNTFLASKGYFVISIQHELPTDSLLPTTGIPQVVRRSNWERGITNILFVLQEAKKRHPALDYRQLILIGHSNGGDMAMLFSSQHPRLVDKVISLDNRRVALPRTRHPHVYSLRSSDQPADEGVLPSEEEQKRYDMKIIRLAHTIHNDMDDDATPEQRKEINSYLLGFLNGR